MELWKDFVRSRSPPYPQAQQEGDVKKLPHTESYTPSNSILILPAEHRQASPPFLLVKNHGPAAQRFLQTRKFGDSLFVWQSKGRAVTEREREKKSWTNRHRESSWKWLCSCVCMRKCNVYHYILCTFLIQVLVGGGTFFWFAHTPESRTRE